ncbi:restriction endonuclease subunit M [Methylovulum psychrotolerans]|uniref:site-specific DNA-methyltransferase (adenine-specific) n=2 Tax=Methylovulum psychrotolerans TaxID=1704499 RepID=A0A1Z4C5C9_9GAMM|nr:restriction endonuclease subunit M [Methylovulum psychrotolerans]
MKGNKQLKPILRWMGGKSKLATEIIEKFPKHTCYVEPFCGGAAVFLKKPRSKAEVINDFNGDLINLYRCIQVHPDELSKQAIGMLHSRWLFDKLKSQNPGELTDIQRAARFYAINRMAFGGRMTAPSFGYGRSTAPGLSAARFKQDIELLTARLDKVYIENLPWADCIGRYDSADTLAYCDPPYWQTAGYGMKFGIDEYVQMAQLAKSMKGKIIISVNNHEKMQQVFDGLNIEMLTIKYSCGNIGKGGVRKESEELLIKNF